MTFPHKKPASHRAGMTEHEIAAQNAVLGSAELLALQAAREQALQRFDQRITQPAPYTARLSLWWLRHTRVLRRSMLALSFAMIAGAGVWLVEGLLVEEEAVDAAILSHELPLDALMEPHFSGAIHD